MRISQILWIGSDLKILNQLPQSLAIYNCQTCFFPQLCGKPVRNSRGFVCQTWPKSLYFLNSFNSVFRLFSISHIWLHFTVFIFQLFKHWLSRWAWSHGLGSRSFLFQYFLLLLKHCQFEPSLSFEKLRCLFMWRICSSSQPHFGRIE